MIGLTTKTFVAKYPCGPLAAGILKVVDTLNTFLKVSEAFISDPNMSEDSLFLLN